MARLKDVVIDCERPSLLAAFWAAVLDGYSIAPYDDAEIARLAARGILSVADDPTVLVCPVGDGPRLFFQAVPEPKVVKNRVHLDLVAGSPDELERILRLGARLADEQENADFLVLVDPEGNEFCLSRL